MYCSIFNGRSMALKKRVQILGLLWILLGNAGFSDFNESTDNSKED